MEIFYELKNSLKTFKSWLVYGPDKYPAGVDPYAFIRVHNEIHLLQASLNSIQGIITRGVIGYNDCTDGSEDVILKFCEMNPGFIPVKYELPVWPPEDKRYWVNTIDEPYGGLDTYYNYIWDHIPNGEWVIKIDADQIYDRERLKKLLTLPRNIQSVVFIPRINLHYQDDRLYLVRSNPLSNVDDHWLLYKTPERRFKLKKNAPPFSEVWEILDIGEYESIRVKTLTWHFPFMKSKRCHLAKKDQLVHLDSEEGEKILSSFSYILSKDMTESSRIKRYLSDLGVVSFS